MKLTEACRLLFWGAFISFLGSLPLGTMNVTATNLAVQKGVPAATQFAWGSMLVEVICVRLALFAIDWVRERKKLFRIFEWVTTGLILALATGSFVAAIKMQAFGNSVFTVSTIHPFILGLILSVLNPLHIPFWFGWSTVLINKNILQPGKQQYNIYVTGIGIGTILGFDVFIYGGNYLVQSLQDHQSVLNCAIGGILLVTALIQIYKIVYKPKDNALQIVS